jgi:hypothetical protein
MIISCCNSDKKLIFFKKKVSTLSLTQFIQLILRTIEILGRWKESVGVSASFEEKEASDKAAFIQKILPVTLSRNLQVID